MNYSEIFQNKTHLILDFDGTIAKILIDWHLWRSGMESIVKKYDPFFVQEGKLDKTLNVMAKIHGQSFRDDTVEFNEVFELKHSKGLIKNDELIEYIRSNQEKRLYILSSNSRKFLEMTLHELTIYDKFDKIITRNDVFFIKPDIEGISKIVDSNNKNDFIMIGDSLSDSGAANGIGIDFFEVKIQA